MLLGKQQQLTETMKGRKIDTALLIETKEKLTGTMGIDIYTVE